MELDLKHIRVCRHGNCSITVFTGSAVRKKLPNYFIADINITNILERNVGE